MTLARTAVMLVLVVALPALAAAGPPIRTEADVDGDGTRDQLELGDEGLTVELSSGRTLVAPIPLAGRTLVGGELSAQNGLVVATLRIDDQGETTTEASAFRISDGSLQPVWSGSVGPQGVDGEYSLHVEPTHQGLLQYQRRPGYERCGAGDSYLFPKLWHRGAFRPVVNVLGIDRDAPRLVAQTEPPQGVDAHAAAAAVAFRAEAASHQLGARHAGELYPPRAIDDGDPTTAWREGMGGIGRGEFVTLRTSFEAPQVRALRLVPGDASSEASFRRNHRIKRLGLRVGDRAYWIDIPSDPADTGEPTTAWWVALPEPVGADCVSVAIADVYRGGRDGDTAIAELAVVSDLDLSPGGVDATLSERVAAGEAGWRSAAQALRRRGAEGARALVTEAEKPDQPTAALARLRRTLARIGSPIGLDQMTAGLVATETDEADRELYARALGNLGAAAIASLEEALADDELSAPARIAAADALAAIDEGAARDALWASTGTGPRRLRKHVARLLAPAVPFEEAAEAIGDAREAGNLPREADVWRIVGYIAAAVEPDELGSIADALARRLATAEDYELHYRLLQAAGPLPSTELIDAVRRDLAGTGQGARDQALRRVAVRALAENPAAEARELIVELAEDPDAGVRLEVSRALGARPDDDPSSDAVLIAHLHRDGWPQIRQTAAGGLSDRCRRPEPAAALRESVATDDDRRVRMASLAALFQCRPEGIGPYLLEVASSGEQPPDVRARAVSLVGALGDSSLVPELVTLFSDARGHGLANEDARIVAQAAAGALGNLGGPEVVDPLITAARDNAFPNIQAASVRALGKLCPAEAIPLFRQLSGSSQAALARSASAALRRCE